MIRAWRPDVVVLMGDLLEGLAASKWPSNERHTLQYEFDSAAVVLEALRKEAPRARWVLCEGNHDANLRGPGRIEQDLHDVIDYRKRLAKALKGVRIIPYENGSGGVYRLGPVTFCHGFDCTEQGERNEACRLGSAGGLYVRGHTHRPVQVTQASINGKVALDRWYANPGTLAGLKPGYTVRQNTDGWGSGVVPPRKSRGAPFSN